MTKAAAARNLERHLAGNSYPGRGIVIGRNAKKEWIQVYWIMGRSPNSRNRIFVVEGDVLRTEAADGSQLEDPSLVIYNAMRQSGIRFIVTNGTQTDTIFDGFQSGDSFVDSMITESHEPDAPNFTPRIAGCLAMPPDEGARMWLSVISASPFDPGHSEHRFFRYTEVPAGYGFCVTTYRGDGNPLPPFQGEPLLMPLEGSADEIRGAFWDALNEENRVSLAVKRIAPDGSSSDIAVTNQYGSS